MLSRSTERLPQAGQHHQIGVEPDALQPAHPKQASRLWMKKVGVEEEELASAWALAKDAGLPLKGRVREQLWAVIPRDGLSRARNPALALCGPPLQKQRGESDLFRQTILGGFDETPTQSLLRDSDDGDPPDAHLDHSSVGPRGLR